jgi:tetratricopeptide (TPR) repeat protein
MRIAPVFHNSIANTLRRTYGWLELGCPAEAYEELEQLPDTLHSTREVLKLKCNILSTASNWNELRTLSATAVMYFPNESAFAEDWAWSEHKQGRTADAYSILKQATEKNQKTWRTAYFLACFAYALKRIREATEWLGLAFLLHNTPAQLKQRALREEDFRS